MQLRKRHKWNSQENKVKAKVDDSWRALTYELYNASIAVYSDAGRSSVCKISPENGSPNEHLDNIKQK